MRPQTLHYGDSAISYTVVRRTEVAGKIAIHVHPDGKVQVDVPDGASPQQIRAAVRKRAHWISRHIGKIRERQQDLLPRQYVSGESHFYLGRRYVLKVHLLNVSEQRSGIKSTVKLVGGQLRVQTINRSTECIKKLLRGWYRVRARSRFESRLVELASKVSWVKQTELPSIKLLEMKKHWGSCSASGSLVLNPHLIKAPRDCIDYVMTHELCHLKEHNHSPEFYRLLSGSCPEWQKTKQRLDDSAELYLNV